jgi:hypothetical protein
MTPEEAIAQIKEIMYPAGDKDAEWSSDELPMIAEVLKQLEPVTYGFFGGDEP